MYLIFKPAWHAQEDKWKIAHIQMKFYLNNFAVL